MTVLVQNIRHLGLIPALDVGRSYRRILPVAVLMMVIATVPGSWAVVAEALSDAYLAVSVFVAGTLALVLAMERAFKTDLGEWLQRYQRWQVPAAAVLGAFPGCGGAIVAITQYTRGYLSFGGVVAALTSTMGDAMFLLLAKEASTAFGILLLGIVVGVISGYLVDAMHGSNFMRPNITKTQMGSGEIRPWVAAKTPVMDQAWLVLMIPGVVIGMLAAFQVDIDLLLSQWVAVSPAFWLGVVGTALAVMMWIRTGNTLSVAPNAGDGACRAQMKPITRSVIDDTNFITVWVAFAFVGYEVVTLALGVDMGQALGIWGPLVPAIAILVGFVPGCGPQIMVTSLYLSGSIPLSAQLGNAIANDGDALFPAIAVAPKAALIATVYSALPAVVVAYGWYVLVE